MRKILPFKHPTYKSLINRNIMQLINRKCWGCCYRNIKTFLLLITLNWREVRSEEWGYSLLQTDWGGSLSWYTWDVSSYWHALFSSGPSRFTAEMITRGLSSSSGRECRSELNIVKTVSTTVQLSTKLYTEHFSISLFELTASFASMFSLN